MRTISYISTAIAVLSVLTRVVPSEGRRVLVVTPLPIYSHQVIYRSICLALQQRGHSVVVFTPNPLNDDSLQNYTEIDFSSIYTDFGNDEFSVSDWYMPQIHDLTERTLNHSEFRKLYNDKNATTFDAVIVELGMAPAIYALAHKLKAPLIGITANELHHGIRYNLGTPILSTHPLNGDPNTGLLLYESFWDRLKNFLSTWRDIYYWTICFANEQHEIAKKYFGSDIPHVVEFGKNISLVLVNHPLPIALPRPEPPNIIYFSGIHITKEPPRLSTNLQRFLDEAKVGFIYISLDTNAKRHRLPQRSLQIFNDVLSKLPYKVLWRYNGSEFQGKPDNVFVSKWVPQEGVLAHQNIKLFIYQGGSRSTEEAVNYAVPLIGIPFTLDQRLNVAKVVSLNVARQIDVNQITRERLRDAIIELTKDDTYKDRMTEMRIILRDKPLNSIWSCIWWIEYVMRHEGAHFIGYSGVHESWYQRSDMDIVASLAILIFIVLFVFGVIISKYIIYAIKRYRASKAMRTRKHKRKLH